MMLAAIACREEHTARAATRRGGVSVREAMPFVDGAIGGAGSFLAFVGHMRGSLLC